ncbi:MAG: hypothetical protein ACFFBJ_08100 [Promethearchaeota archaeon]
MTQKDRKKKKDSSLGHTIPARYRNHPMMLTRWMTDIDNYARKHKRKRTPRALKHQIDNHARKDKRKRTPKALKYPYN